jgi:hypothetical protein
MGTEGSSHTVKGPGRETEPSASIYDRVKNEWRYKLTPPYFFMGICFGAAVPD